MDWLVYRLVIGVPFPHPFPLGSCQQLFRNGAQGLNGKR